MPLAEGPNAGGMQRCGDLVSAKRPNSRYLAFEATGKGEAGTALLEGTEADTAGCAV